MKSNSFLFAFIAILLFSTGTILHSQVITPFTPVYQVTQKGGIIYLANSSLGCSSNPPLAALSATCAAGTAVAAPSGVLRDNDFISAYIDVDGDPSTFMSSSDSLDLPSCSEITKAFLFWGASGAATNSLNTCRMKIGNGSYQTVTAIASQTNNIGFNTYHCYADVSSILQSGGLKSRVTVANIGSSSLGVSNTFGSWCIAVVFKNDLRTMRQLTVFKGLANISGSAPTVNVPISGFLTPLAGPVTMEVGLYVHDGDRASTGDGLSFRGAASFIPLSDAVNPVSDVMNSTVSYNGTLTPFRKPNMNNTSGLDADIFVPNNSTKNYIGNAATSATFQMTTGGETYLPQMVTTALDVYEPDLRASIKARDVNGGALVPGDIVEYRIKGINIGSDPSLNSFITDTLDIRADYIPNSTRVVYGAVTGTMTDASGDDLVDYNPLTSTLKIRIGSGATSAIGGTVINSPAGVDSTIVTYSVMCTSSCVKIACSPSIDAQAFIWGTGATSSNIFSNGSNPGIFNTLGCPIPGTTSSPITATTCVTPAASNSGPGCVGLPVVLSAPPDTEVSYLWSGPGSFSSAISNPTIAAATATMAGLYTVTLSVSGSSCSAVLNTSLTIGVCTPTAVNDFSNTIVNTTVSGNVASNDLNLTSPVFSITTPPTNGNLTLNAATGQYTFIPNTNFTGTTSATYAVCNQSLCSSAILLFTVYPALVANPDQINATPSQTLSSSLLINDAGATGTLLATYSVTASPLSPAIGTLVLNPATGQYTFSANSLFTGSTQITYTVCNTTVNPNVCSTSSVIMNVFPLPAPVNDFTTTVSNTTVQANAASNDSGTAGATFSLMNQPNGGTLTINATSGVYSFTASSAFSGVTTASYNLCNGSAITCSTAVITITVHPVLVANSDVINTSPTSSVTANLLGNDAGITSTLGATYSVTVNPPSSATGSIVVNSSTGQYTFTPNPSYTGSVQTTYQVCNTAVNPQQCSTATITINVFPMPVPVNDFTNTVINTAVVGNAASNDSGKIGGTFSLTAQPAGGSVVMNASTGQFTFTPSTTFTGVTTATYNLCNGAPVTCSTAVITITVHPAIVANLDVINTSPTSSVTANLLINDAGITTTLGATYSVTVNPPSSATGSIVVNSSTGQYTFTPNPLFTGSVQTTYQVCNTAVNPQQCSTATITINVFPMPVPVNDFTNTVINTAVVGNAASNDSGKIGGTFSLTAQPTGGAVVMNASTGQFTFTPSTTFTGVTTATYNLCNGAPVTCSTAVISITVYPALVANADQIVTTPSVTATGSLVSNDAGVVSGAIYSVAVTPLNTTTGTLTLNSATGAYTFVPNSSFTGTASTTYTICNTSVNPIICSSASILIQVGNTPVAVADFTTTLINTVVTGSAGINDGGVITALNPIFTISQPLSGTGTVSVNASTGVYSYTPATGFTGTTSCTYTLCNSLSPPCSTTAITFSVYPAIVTNSDIVSTTPGVVTSGSLALNDVGILTSGTLTANYQFTLSPVSASVGTFAVNAANGQYVFTPNSSFTGSAQTTYTVCNTSVNPSVCSSTTVIIYVYPTPAPANDFTTTTSGGIVSGNAAANDSGTTSAVFSLVNQPTGGTLTINSVSGVYSFTAAPAFTGVTTASYNLCNGAATSCSTAVISITVHPLIVANPDIINTSPTTSVTGNLLGNDAGITTTLGATYSVTLNQPSASSGSFVLNSSTGQYTFIPNSTFSGSVQTTYQVCNTAVNAPQCSTATITINVFPGPVPVNDFTTTLINTPVYGNAASNDIGVSGGTFSITVQPAGGTVILNSSTGQFTFTPSPSFTGVTTATYNLCNGAPVTCSTAVISITVYPALVANADQIVTTPSVTATGSLVSNDAGVVLGAIYSLSVTPLNTTTGTLTLNSATGAYTFVPNSSFTGTASTTYTICNTSVNPIICSSASILIQVGNTPVAVADFTTTLINTVVTGSAGINDGGVITALNPIFTISQPLSGTGTVSVNASTGVYSYTPATGFTGTTSCTYTLCNSLSPPCSTTAITFSVYPAIVTNSDIVSTTPGVVTSGSLALNDVGILTSGTLTANYQFTLSPVSASVGTFAVNAANGQYVFTPNSSFTGSAQTTYTVCNTSVNPSVCSSTTVIIYVYPTPAPANDFTTTTSGGIVSGNAAANDSGTTSAVFSLVNQPTGGTLTINSVSGVYSFTAAPAFTGVTTASYNLCNGAATSCSTAVISITVHPLIVANPDIINTSPTTSVTGNLLGNDAGITTTLGATYSVTLNQPSASSGSFVLNSSTGQYTFIPNSTFSGSVQTTYQVCNTAVNAPQCSTATITINVFPGPVPVNDFTTTLINTPVYGNAASNDIGVSGGTFSITVQPAGGTVILNSSTGQFTFTPSPSFTGVTTATYNLCNGAPVTCSPAVISITVYPALVAVDDLVQTSSTVAVNGSLLNNDLGVIAGSSYTVSVSPVAPASGTLVVNASNGQYTFTPNPAFSGSLTTTYTVCNINVNPIICSTATLTIFVGDMPIAVDDEAVTIIDTPVSGGVALNDSNLTNAIFTFGMPGNGTITANSATGQYTFTPAAGFTGTTSVTYTLCNIVSPPCATAVVNFTVYPELKAINDQTVTNVNTPVSGTLTANDLGIIAGGVYSVSVSQPSSGSGTIVVNAADGTYTFTPSTGYTGGVLATYTLCQTNPNQCSSATISIIVGARSSIGLSKVLSKTEYNSDGTLNQTYKLVVKNMGNQLLSDIAISDDLSATYPSPSTFTLQSITASDAAGTQIALDNTYTGAGTKTVMTIPMTSSLAVGKTDTIVFQVKVSPNGFSGTYNNLANVTAIGSSTLVADASVNSLDPDPDGDGNPQNNTSPTTFTCSLVKIGIAKSVSNVEIAGSGCHNITFKFTIKNYGTATIYNVSVIDNLEKTFGSTATYSVLASPSSLNNLLIPNANFTGNGNNVNLVAPGSSLTAGATDTLILKVKYCLKGTSSFSNVAQASASSLPEGGFTGSDDSDNGTDPDPNNNNNPSDEGENLPTVFTPEGEFFIPQGFSPNNDGVNDELRIRGIENYPANEFSIINRWGNVVYKKKGYDNSWNGTSNMGINYGSDQLPEGTYFYILDLGDGQKALKGFIYLNRSIR